MAAERVDCSNEVVANLANGGIFLFRGIQVPEKQPNIRKYFSMLENTLDMQAAWLFHLVGDIHQPLHMVQLFTREYPNGDRGGNEICVRVTPDRGAIDLHRLWDGLITSSNNVGQLSRIATELMAKFSRVGLCELEHTTPEAWAKESYGIATKIAYENGGLRGTPKGAARDCREVRDANFLSRGYPQRAKLIADRRIFLAGYRLAQFLRTVPTN